MSAKKRIVVDASIGRSCGGRDAAATAAACRDVLVALLTYRYRAVMSNALEREWDVHQSKFARMWRVSMISKGLIYRVADESHRRVTNAVIACGFSPSEMRAVQKDFHLVRAALATDRTVISRDDEAKRLFSVACSSVAELRRIIWMNPANEADECQCWLHKGAKHEIARCLGARLS